MKSIHGGDIYNNKVNMDFSVNINPLGIPHSVKEAMSCLLYTSHGAQLLYNRRMT